MCEQHDDDCPQPVTPLSGPARRAFLRSAALAGAGAAAVGAVGISPAAAAGAEGGAEGAAADAPVDAQGMPAWRPDRDSRRFTLVVMPDTQYMFDEPSITTAPIEASFRYILEHAREDNIVFMAHLGDLTQNGRKPEFDGIGRAFEVLDRKGVAYSVLAGNHDIDSGTDDRRGRSAYLDTFGPQRFRGKRSFGGATPDGYNTYHLFQAGGREWLVLALDWRPSPASIAWARKVMADHPRSPVILTSHELVSADVPGREAEFSDHGRRLWDELIKGNDQIFLTLNGHYWPAGRSTRRNDAGNDVHLHITNYQNRYFGGAAMIRLYHFDLDRDTIDVQTLSPWILGRNSRDLNELERREMELTGPDDYFSVPVDFDKRFARFAPIPQRPARPAARMVVPGTVAYWRFDGAHQDGAPVPGGQRVKDLSGRGNDLTLIPAPGAAAGSVSWSGQYHPDQPGHGSVRLAGGKSPLRGGHFQTANDAPLNRATFRSGYTVEAFFKLPADWDGGKDAWSALLSRWGMSGEARKPQGDPQEPVVTLSLSGGRELQWCVYPLDGDGSATNWGHELALDAWWHVAVVNDSRQTTMYIDGCPVVRNPTARANGLTTLNLPWMLGGYAYDGKLDQTVNAWVGDVRVVDRALRPDAFMIGR
ncbi:LamG-like jellyroll fold domain-containing protein [Embleya sp. NPDC056575]|uniref:LamG-like jellyroll fold domain-containing protein n=1 Tax=unclassified Embleya TaxID=2699296 RepID=UPI00367EBD10